MKRSTQPEVADPETRAWRILEDLTEHVSRMDPDGVLIFVNPAFARFYGKGAAELVGRPLQELLPEGTRRAVQEHLAALTPQDSVRSLEHRACKGDGTIGWLERTDRGFFDAEGHLVEVQSVARDITARLQAEEERRRLEAQVLHSQKLEGLALMAGGIAHDFNNLLVGVMGHANLAMEELPHQSLASDHLERILDAAEQAAGLCKQLLAYSGRGRFVVQPLHLGKLVAGIRGFLESQVEEDVDLRLHIPDELPLIEGDATQLRQAVVNLVTNAAEALGDEGNLVAVAVGSIDCDEEYLRGTFHPASLPPGTYVFIEVEDDGEGIPEDVLGRIFDPFFTTKFTGRGLGLAATLGIVQGHGGAIKVESRPGEGTVLRALFPVSTRAEQVRQQQRRRARGHPARGEGLVLVVDDEAVVRKVASQMVQRLGYEVAVASSGPEAIEIFRERHGEVAAVLLDLTMPKMMGDEVYQRMRAIDPGVPVILSSGYDRDEVMQRVAGLGPVGFVKKPYGVGELDQALRTALERR